MTIAKIIRTITKGKDCSIRTRRPMFNPLLSFYPTIIPFSVPILHYKKATSHYLPANRFFNPAKPSFGVSSRAFKVPDFAKLRLRNKPGLAKFRPLQSLIPAKPSFSKARALFINSPIPMRKTHDISPAE